MSPDLLVHHSRQILSQDALIGWKVKIELFSPLQGMPATKTWRSFLRAGTQAFGEPERLANMQRGFALIRGQLQTIVLSWPCTQKLRAYMIVPGCDDIKVLHEVVCVLKAATGFLQAEL